MDLISNEKMSFNLSFRLLVQNNFPSSFDFENILFPVIGMDKSCGLQFACKYKKNVAIGALLN